MQSPFLYCLWSEVQFSKGDAPVSWGHHHLPDYTARDSPFSSSTWEHYHCLCLSHSTGENLEVHNQLGSSSFQPWKSPCWRLPCPPAAAMGAGLCTCLGPVPFLSNPITHMWVCSMSGPGPFLSNPITYMWVTSCLGLFLSVALSDFHLSENNPVWSSLELIFYFYIGVQYF